jgi:two-component system, chemotaxis family, chemotaxis protein CheY
MPYNFENLEIIIADDNEFMRHVIRTTLQALGFQRDNIEEAECGEEVLKILKTNTPDLIITDLNMKPINGLELTRHIRRSENSLLRFMPVMICTGHAETSYIIAARDAGATEIVCKPISAMSLYQHIAAIIEHPREFVQSPEYIGPDRRRRDVPFEGQDRRASEVEI